MKKIVLVGLMVIFGGLALVGPVLSAGTAIKDAESASHADSAALVSVIGEYQYPGFRVIQFELAVLSQFSYMVVSDNKAVVVDPIRDVQAYLDYAAKHSLTIEAVWLTHNNADFVAGHMELARAAKCPIYISHKAGAGFANQPVEEGSVIVVGQARIKILETPGHTPESTCGVLSASSQPDKPLALISGDTLFIGSVGRPDLMGGQMAAATLASMMYDTWFNKLTKLPDHVNLYPAHGAGSLCGAHLSDEPTSTIGVQRQANPYLKHKSRGDFIAAVLEGLPEAPQYFKHNAAMNKKGPALILWQAPPAMEDPPGTELTDPVRRYVVDLREAKPFAEGHIPNSVNIGLRGRLETWTGIMVPWGSNLVVCGSEAEIKEAIHRLHRIGYRAKGVTMAAWKKAGHELITNKMISPQELYQAMQRPDSPVVVDVRLPNEWMGLRIGTVLNIPLSDLAKGASKLDPKQPVVAVCNSAYRSSMAVGVLERIGFKEAMSLDGGSQAWIEAGLPVYGPDKPGQAKAAPAKPVAQRQIHLAERISAAELKRLMLDLPGTFDLIDIRPPSQFNDYNIPGSTNVDIAELINSAAYLTGAGPLIIVDRDGSLAMMAAGILSQKTKRPIKALYGGLEAYWAGTELNRAVAPVALPTGPKTGAPPKSGAAPAMKPAPAPRPAAPAAPAKPQKPKRPSAGC